MEAEFGARSLNRFSRRMALVAACLLALLASCGKRKMPGARGTPKDVVKQMFQLQAQEKYEAAAAVVDFQSLAKKCSGNLWAIGSREEKTNLEEAFRQSWMRQAPDERLAFRGAEITFEQSRGAGAQGRAIVSVSIQGAGSPYSTVKGIDFPMARYLGRWRVIGQVLHYEQGLAVDEANLCAPMVRLARERAERRRVEVRLGDLAQVLNDLTRGGSLPNR